MASIDSGPFRFIIRLIRRLQSQAFNWQLVGDAVLQIPEASDKDLAEPHTTLKRTSSFDGDSFESGKHMT